MKTTRKSTTRGRVTTLALAGVLVMSAITAPALAREDTTEDSPAERLHDAWDDARDKMLAGIKKHAQKAVDHRLATLSNLTDWAGRDEHVTEAHASQLLGDFAAGQSGLLALNEDIRATRTIEEALRLTEKIASDYRVYLVILPKTAGVVVGDSMVAATERIDEAAAGVQDAIDRLADLGHDVSGIQAAVDDAQTQADSAAVLAAAVPGSVIDLGAADWLDPAEATLKSAKSDLESSASEIRAAVSSLMEAIHLIRDAVGSDG